MIWGVERKKWGVNRISLIIMQSELVLKKKKQKILQLLFFTSALWDDEMKNL